MICGFSASIFLVFLLVYHQFNSLVKESGFVGAVASATDTKAEFLKIRKNPADFCDFIDYDRQKYGNFIDYTRQK